MQTAADFGYPFTDTVLLQSFVQQYLNRKGVNIRQFHDNLPGKEWVKNCLARNPELRRNAENIKRARADLSPQMISNYFTELSVTVTDIPPENIVNYDEMNFTDDPGKKRVLVRRRAKHAYRILGTSKSSVSVMFAGAGNGDIFSPYIVYKSNNLHPEWMQGGPDRSISGWFDSIIFEDWFNKIAVPYFRRMQGRKILIGDNLGSHLSYNVLKFCEENQVSFVLLPPNSTHLCQPLDVAVFRTIKAKWREILMKWKENNAGCSQDRISTVIKGNDLTSQFS
ncbi:hypothetical protein NQ314_017049 [Rhamnusium bicolor]|uniref:DDE-1 domain-containing protein n=1 Tax=Rhamnusium bicolor TaxID=1586634 RepID=A0AAV8WVR3_9CUCU|nr:hypothetical protein NQ314_017049 [Rhamnusium bicolor]